jgi:hypothetical protein
LKLHHETAFDDAKRLIIALKFLKVSQIFTHSVQAQLRGFTALVHLPQGFSFSVMMNVMDTAQCTPSKDFIFQLRRSHASPGIFLSDFQIRSVKRPTRPREIPGHSFVQSSQQWSEATFCI